MSEELKPCPFCGVVPEWVEKTADGRNWYGVVCRSGKGLGGTCAVSIRPSASIEAATTRWNARADTAHQAEIERLKERLRAYLYAAHDDTRTIERQDATIAQLRAALDDIIAITDRKHDVWDRAKAAVRDAKEKS